MTGDWRDVLSRAWYARAWWLWLLRPVEILFRLLASLRRTLYQSGVLHSYRAAKPVVVVGNITVGGTGKTPVVIALVEALQCRGITVGVVSRGYGATASDVPLVVSDTSSTAQCGDEPLLIHRRTGCPCVVAPSRAAAVRKLITEFNPDIILCDDGLQHYALKRDLEIAVFDAQRRWGNGFCLPAGPLREPVARLRTVDFVLYRGGKKDSSAICYEQDALVNLASAEQRAVSPEKLGPRVHAVAGIGQPEQFFSALEQRGFGVEHHVFPDHHCYEPADFGQLMDRPIIMTEKDAVKCRDMAGPDAWYLKISAQLPDEVIDAVAKLVNS